MSNLDSAVSLPIACNLDVSSGVERMERWRRLGRDAQVDSERLPDAVRVRYHDSPAVEAEVVGLAAAERDCCPFLQFEIGRRDVHLELLIRATADAEDAELDHIADLFGLVR